MYKYSKLVNNSQLAFKQLLPLFKKYLKKQETMVAIALNTHYYMIGKPWRLSLGTLHETVTHPRDLFREAVKRNAFSVIIAHNHPSGMLEPSLDDMNLTKRLKDAGGVIGIPVVDHLIITHNGYRSLSDNAEM